HQGQIRGVAFHPEGKFFASAGQDGTVRFWSLKGRELLSLAQSGPASCLAFDPSGRTLATGGDRTVLLWDIDAEKIAAPGSKPAAPVFEPREFVWIEDAAPAGARLLGETPWEFVTAPKHPVHSGEKSTRRQAKGVSTHYFEGATRRLKLAAGDKLF